MADSKLKEFPGDRQFLNGLENGTVSVLRWRAQSDADSDMVGIKKVLLISTVVLFVAVFIMMSTGIQPNIFFASIFLVNLMLFSSVQWFLDIKKETIKMVGFMILIVALPWIMHLLGESVGFSQESDYHFLVELSLFRMLGASMMLGASIIMFTIPSIALLWSVKAINKASFVLVNIERQKVQLFFVAVNILVPIWFFVKDRLA